MQTRWHGVFRAECVRGAERNRWVRVFGHHLELRCDAARSPAVAVADRQATLFEGEQGIAEAGIVDAQPLAQGGPGQGWSASRRAAAHGLGERWRRGGTTVEAQRQRLLAAAGETDQEGIGRGCGAMFDGEQQAPVGAAHEVAGGVGPGVQVG